MKISKHLKLFIKKFNQFDNWISRPRVKKGEIFDSESYRGIFYFILFCILTGVFFWYYPYFKEYSEPKITWLRFWGMVIVIPGIVIGFWKLTAIYIKRNYPQKHDKLIQAIVDNQNKALDLHKQQTLSKSIEEEIGKIEVPKVIPTSLTIEKKGDNPHPSLVLKSTRLGGSVDEPKEKDKR